MDGHNGDMYICRVEDFAEAIVGECIEYLNTEIDRLCAYQNTLHIDDHEGFRSVDIAIEKCIDNIKGLENHFGLKE
jgi:hypothetical protein